MKTEQVLLYAGGAFLLYKLFVAPKTTTIPTQAAPVYTSGLITQQPVSNTGTLVTAGLSTVATILKSVLSPGSTSTQQGSQPVVTSSPQQTAVQSNINDSVSDIFSSVPSVLSTNNSAANNFGLPTSFSFTDDED